MPSAGAHSTSSEAHLGFLCIELGFPQLVCAFPGSSSWEDRPGNHLVQREITSGALQVVGHPRTASGRPALSPGLGSPPWSLQFPQVLRAPCSLQQESGGYTCRAGGDVTEGAREPTLTLPELVPVCRSWRRVLARPPSSLVSVCSGPRLFCSVDDGSGFTFLEQVILVGPGRRSQWQGGLSGVGLSRGCPSKECVWVGGLGKMLPMRRLDREPQTQASWREGRRHHFFALFFDIDM